MARGVEGECRLLRATDRATYPGSDAQVLAFLAQLGPAAPAVTLPPVASPTKPAPRFVETGTDQRFDACGDAKSSGYGPYHRGDTEYGW